MAYWAESSSLKRLLFMSKRRPKSKRASKSTAKHGHENIEAVPCRLFLATPTQFEVDDLTPVLENALAGGDVACVMIGHEDAIKLESSAKVLTPIAQAKDVAVLIEGSIERSIEIAQKVDADGIVVGPSIDEYRQARAALGDDKIVGIDCGLDRHVAMALGEEGADFVIFDDETAEPQSVEKTDEEATQLKPDQINEPIANWWARVFEVPCVVMAPQSGFNAIGNVKASIKSGVEFICPPNQMWESAALAKQTVCDYNQLIKETPVDEV